MLNHFDSNQGLLFLIKKKKTKTQEKSLPTKYRNENKSFDLQQKHEKMYCTAVRVCRIF